MWQLRKWLLPCQNLDREYSETFRYVRACLSLKLVRAFILLVWGARGGNPHKSRRMPAEVVEASILKIRVV